MNYCEVSVMLALRRILPLLLTLGSSETVTAGNAACQALIGVRRPTAVLVDPHGTLSKGPVDFGHFPYRYDANRSGFEIRTGYRLITAPKQFTPKEQTYSSGHIVLRQTGDLCAGTRTLEISVAKREEKSANGVDQFELPLQYEIPIELLEVEAQSPPAGFMEFEMKFDARVVGTIVRATSEVVPGGRSK